MNLPRDIIFEISKYCLHYDLRNFKFAFPEIELTESLYSQIKDLSENILEDSRNKSLKYFICSILTSKEFNRFILNIYLISDYEIRIVFNKYIIFHFGQRFFSGIIDSEIKSIFLISDTLILLDGYQFIKMILTHRMTRKDSKLSDLTYLEEIIKQNNIRYKSLKSFLGIVRTNNIPRLDIIYDPEDVATIISYLSENNRLSLLEQIVEKLEYDKVKSSEDTLVKLANILLKEIDGKA